MLSRLKVRDFRCFDALEIEFDPATNVFAGANAQGKTSLLEAICVLLRLQSPRVNALGHALRHGRRGFVVDGYYERRHLQFYYSPERKKLALDSVEQKSAREYLRIARVVSFSNQDIDIVRGPGEQRRRFMDFLGAQIEPAYRVHLRAYEKALRSRNRLLRLPSPSRREIAAFTVPLVDAGSALSALRARLIEQIQPLAAEAIEWISGKADALTMGYTPGSGPDFGVSVQAAEADDFRRGQTTVGPHRDDLRMELNEMDSFYASEGQQRGIVLALKLAEARLIEGITGIIPLLLIDDVFGELDLQRRNALIRFLPASAQKFVTATHLDWMEDAGAAVFRVAGGTIEREPNSGSPPV